MPNLDLFEALDIGHREDSYSRLLVEVMRRFDDVRSRVFQTLTGHEPLSWPSRPDDAVLFRQALRGGRDEADAARSKGRSIPDIQLVAETASGKRLLLVENKIWAGEGSSQCLRYQADAEAQLDQAHIHGVFLTLRGDDPEGKVWRGKRHDELFDLMNEGATAERLQTDPVLGPAWSAYGNRLRHHSSYPSPSDDEQVATYLQRPAEYFVTASDRCDRLGDAVKTEGWKVSGGYYHGAGRQYGLLQAWRDHWLGARLPEGDLAHVSPAEHLSLHFESILPVKGSLKALASIGCAVHFETNPYLTQAELKEHPRFYERFSEGARAFQQALHERLIGSEWKPRRHEIQKASLGLHFDHPPTVRQLKAQFRTAIASIDEAMTASLETAKVAMIRA